MDFQPANGPRVAHDRVEMLGFVADAGRWGGCTASNIHWFLRWITDAHLNVVGAFNNKRTWSFIGTSRVSARANLALVFAAVHGLIVVSSLRFSWNQCPCAALIIDRRRAARSRAGASRTARLPSKGDPVAFFALRVCCGGQASNGGCDGSEREC
jgi:hypothetical protein